VIDGIEKAAAAIECLEKDANRLLSKTVTTLGDDAAKMLGRLGPRLNLAQKLNVPWHPTLDVLRQAQAGQIKNTHRLGNILQSGLTWLDDAIMKAYQGSFGRPSVMRAG
jgi:hypothetical protein